MVSYYGRLLKLVQKSYPPEEFKKYPDYSWLIYNLVCFISPSKKFPKVPPEPSDFSYWGDLFWKYYMLTATNSSTPLAILGEFESPPTAAAAQIMFDLIPETLQDKFHLWILNHLGDSTNP